MSTVLQNIIDEKRRSLALLKSASDIDELQTLVANHRSPAKSFRDAVSDPSRINIISEFKRASPSKGMIAKNADAAESARNYEAAGACAISVLTEESFFLGSLDDLKTIRAASSLPILRKDFVIDEFQIYEAAASGANAVLLIMAALGESNTARFAETAQTIGVDALIEVHTIEEMRTASQIGATLIGVNNRDLNTFDVSLDVSRKLVEHAPDGAVLVSESGLSSAQEIIELRQLGYSAFLIGEALMRGGSLAELVNASV